MIPSIWNKRKATEQAPDSSMLSTDGQTEDMLQRIRRLEADVQMLKDALDRLTQERKKVEEDVLAQKSDNAAALPEKTLPQETTLFLSAPTTDGIFQECSSEEKVGKSLYVLHTHDSDNGTFAILDTPEALATAMISISQIIKPVCRVKNTPSSLPRHVVTESEGTAKREGNVWRMTTKAVIWFTE